MKIDLKVYGTAPSGALLVSADEVNTAVQGLIDEIAKLRQVADASPKEADLAMRTPNELQQRNAKLADQVDILRKDAVRYRWIKEHIEEEVCQRGDEFVGVKTKYKLPLMMAFAEFCGQISFDEAVDMKRNESRNKKARY